MLQGRFSLDRGDVVDAGGNTGDHSMHVNSDDNTGDNTGDFDMHGNSGGSSELLMDEDENVIESFLQDT